MEIPQGHLERMTDGVSTTSGCRVSVQPPAELNHKIGQISKYPLMCPRPGVVFVHCRVRCLEL